MSTITGTLGKSIGLFGLSLVGFFFICCDAAAQSENEKMEEVFPRPFDKPITPMAEDQASLHDNTNSLFSPALKMNQNKTFPVKRDLPAGGVMSDKDPKKIDTPSTLSFNIFLYVVDKFKENNLKAD
jgi:hypothetical protein